MAITGLSFQIPSIQSPTPTTPNLSNGANGISLSNTGLPKAPSILSDTGNPTIAPTPTGGVSFDSKLSNGFNASASTQANVAQTPSGALSDYIIKNTQTPNGGNISTTGTGQVSGYNPNAGFQIGTSGAVPSTALTSNISTNDLNQKHSQYSDYVQGLAEAQGYSPEYIQALQSQQQAQAQGAALQTNSAALNSNLYTGNNLPGDTMNYAQGATAKAQAQNTLQQSQNSLQQLSANQQLQVQALIRSGNIAAAQSLVQASQPVGVSPGTSLVSPINGQESYSGLGGLTGVNAVNQYNSLQQQYPNAQIPPYNQALSPAENQQLAQQAVAQSPAYQSQFQGTYTTPGGGLGTYSKLDQAQQINQGGTGEIVSGAAVATGSADASSLSQQQQYLDTTNRAYQTATSNLGTLQQFMQQNNLNDSTLPILNQIQNKVKAGILAPGVVAAYQSSLAGLRSEYAQVLSRGGAVTDTERNEALSLIPDNLSPSQLQIVTKQLSTEGGNAIKESQNQINTIKGRLGGQSSSTTSTGWY